MKIASSGASFDTSIAGGDLTQLEWLTLCSSSLALDGVVFEARHFPRTDDEYLAQLKKTAVDLGLTVAALAADALLAPDGRDWIAIAGRLGAPILITRTPPTTGAFTAWNDTVASLKQAASSAKRADIVIGLRNGPGTLCANTSDLKRLAKDVDSSWLRYALDLTAPPSEPFQELLTRTVIACADISADGEGLHALAGDLRSFRGFLCLDTEGGNANEGDLAHLISLFRATAFEAAWV
jgi:hypothetical protein